MYEKSFSRWFYRNKGLDDPRSGRLNLKEPRLCCNHYISVVPSIVTLHVHYC